MSFTFFQISALITAFVSFFLGISVYSRDRKSRINLFWLFISFSISMWSMGLFGVVFSEDRTNAWFWQHVLDVGGIMIPVLYFTFVLYLLKKEKEFLRTIVLSWIVGIILIVLSFTKLFKTDISSKFGLNYWIDPGKLYFLFPLIFTFFIALSTFVIIKIYYQTHDAILRRQLKWLLFAQVFGFGGGITNFFPQLFNLYPFGNYLVILYVVCISYAAIQHRLFNIRLIATEMLVFAVWVFLLVKVAFSKDQVDLIINGGLLILVFIAGGLLIRSVWKEVKQREKMEQMAKELERAYNVEKEARAKIQELDEAKTQFLMATQHHFRTPLTSMRGYIDLILTGTYGKISPKVKEAVLKLETSTIRLIRIVNELLDVSQFQLGKKVVSLEAGIRIEPILKEVLDELKFTAKSKGIYLKFERPENPLPPAMADVEKLKVALYNIIDNGIKYTNKGGITIRCRVLDNELEIMSKDTGIGITPEEKGGLFAGIFERGKEAKKVFTTGRGIGLYISGQIIKAHNGKVWVESEGRGKGSTFHIRLPLS